MLERMKTIKLSGISVLKGRIKLQLDKNLNFLMLKNLSNIKTFKSKIKANKSNSYGNLIY